MFIPLPPRTTDYKLLLLLPLLAVFNFPVLLARVELPYGTGFERNGIHEDYVDGASLSGHWASIDPSITVTAEAAHSGAQSVRISAAEPENIVSLSFNPSNHSILYLDYSMQLTASSLPLLPLHTSPETTTLVTLHDYAPGLGAWVFLDGDGAGGGTWRYTQNTVPLSNTYRTRWHRITLRLNFNSNTWDAYIDRQLIAVNLGFAEAMFAGSEAINIYGNRQGPTYLDTFSLRAQNPLFIDADQDGIDDAYETLYGLSTTTDDRDLDPDADGLSNVEEYMFETHPLASNAVDIILPNNNSPTQIHAMQGNLVVVNNNNILWSKSLDDIYSVNLIGSDPTSDIDIDVGGTLKGFLNIKGDVGTITFNQALTVTGDLFISRATHVIFNASVYVHGTTTVDVSNDIRVNASLNSREGVNLDAGNDLILNNGVVHAASGFLVTRALGNIAITNNSALTATDGYSMISTSNNLTITHSTIAYNSTTLFLQVQGQLHVSHSAIHVETGIVQLIIFNHATFTTSSNFTVSNGALYGQFNRNLTISDESTIITNEGTAGLNVIGNTLVERNSALQVNNTTAADHTLNLIVSGITTFDSECDLVAFNTELNIFSYGGIYVVRSAITTSNQDAFLRTNATLVLAHSTLSFNQGNVSVNTAQSVQVTASDFTVNQGNLFLNTRTDMMLGAASALRVIGGDVYATVIGEANFEGIIDLDNMFALYVQGNFTQSSASSLQALTIYLSAGQAIAVHGKINSSTVDGRIYMVSQNRIVMASGSLITSHELKAIGSTGIVLNTNVDQLSVQTVGRGLNQPLSLGNYKGSAEIMIHEVDDITILKAYNADGPIRVMAGGTITARELVSTTDAAGHDVGLISTEGDIIINTISVGMTRGHIALSANGAIREVPDFDDDADLVGSLAVIHAGSAMSTSNEALEINVAQLHTFKNNNSPWDSDTDADGISDHIEYVYQALNPNRATDIFEDYDNDGIPNIFEIYNHTNPDSPASTPARGNDSATYFIVDASQQETGAFISITAAIAAAQNHNYAIIEVLPGTYVEQATLTFPVLLIASQGPDHTIIHSTIPTKKALTLLDASMLDGFTFLSEQGFPVELNTTQPITLKNCSIAATDTPSQLTHGGGVSRSGGILNIIDCYMPKAI